MVTFRSGKSSPFERVEFSLYISFLIFTLKFKQYSDSTQTIATVQACLVFCLPDLRACMLGYEIKTNASCLYKNTYNQKNGKWEMKNGK